MKCKKAKKGKIHKPKIAKSAKIAGHAGTAKNGERKMGIFLDTFKNWVFLSMDWFIEKKIEYDSETVNLASLL